MQRSKCQECGLVSLERDLCPRCKSPLFGRRAAPAVTAESDEPVKTSSGPLRTLATAMIVLTMTYAGYQGYRYMLPETEADRERMLLESPDLDYMIGGPDGQTREDKVKALKQSGVAASARADRARQAIEDKKAWDAAHSYDAMQQKVPGPPQQMVPMPNNPQAMIPAHH